jgi:hypothetical protein
MKLGLLLYPTSPTQNGLRGKQRHPDPHQLRRLMYLCFLVAVICAENAVLLIKTGDYSQPHQRRTLCMDVIALYNGPTYNQLRREIERVKENIRQIWNTVEAGHGVLSCPRNSRYHIVC